MSRTINGVSGGRIFSRLPDIVPREIAGETILVPVRGELARLDRIFVLNSLGEFIWHALDGHATIAEISAAIVDAFEVDADVANDDLIEFVCDL